LAPFKAQPVAAAMPMNADERENAAATRVALRSAEYGGFRAAARVTLDTR
jgi:hypothetical protein